VLFEYDPSRSQEVPLRLLMAFMVSANRWLCRLQCRMHNNNIPSSAAGIMRAANLKDAQDAQPKPKKGKPHKASKADHHPGVNQHTLYD